jgi:hypothetical protein
MLVKPRLQTGEPLRSLPYPCAFPGPVPVARPAACASGRVRAADDAFPAGFPFRLPHR